MDHYIATSNVLYVSRLIRSGITSRVLYPNHVIAEEGNCPHGSSACNGSDGGTPRELLPLADQVSAGETATSHYFLREYCFKRVLCVKYSFKILVCNINSVSESANCVKI